MDKGWYEYYSQDKKGSHVNYSLKYSDKRRWISYYWQIYYIFSLNVKDVLEIGPGFAVVGDVIKRHLIYKMMDINDDLNPDYVGSVTKVPIKDNRFDLIICCEVLEHIRFEDFRIALRELQRVTKRWVMISLPYACMFFHIGIDLFGFKLCDISFRIPKFWERHSKDKYHYWEIGKRGYPINRIKKVIKEYFKIEKCFYDKLNPYHQFFILKK
jgi:hypothetical protein